jgi:hypothetical protein
MRAANNAPLRYHVRIRERSLAALGKNTASFAIPNRRIARRKLVSQPPRKDVAPCAIG